MSAWTLEGKERLYSTAWAPGSILPPHLFNHSLIPVFTVYTHLVLSDTLSSHHISTGNMGSDQGHEWSNSFWDCCSPSGTCESLPSNRAVSGEEYPQLTTINPRLRRILLPMLSSRQDVLATSRPCFKKKWQFHEWRRTNHPLP